MEELNNKIELINKLVNQNIKVYVISNNYMKRKYIYDKLNTIYDIYSIDNISNKEYKDIVICNNLYMDNILKDKVDLNACFLFLDGIKKNKPKIKMLR